MYKKWTMNKLPQKTSVVKNIIKAKCSLKEENIKSSIYTYYYYELKSFFNIIYIHKIKFNYLKLKKFKVKYNE